MGHKKWAARLRRVELTGALAFGAGLLAAAALNFAFVGAMGRLLDPPVFGTLGVLVAALLAVTAPVNALQGGTEMFAALHDRFPRGKARLWPPAIGLSLWAITMVAHSTTVRATGWFILGSAALLLLSWNRGALAGLGRFSFVGLSFIVDGTARLLLALAFVAAGFGLIGASAGFALGIVLALVATELAVPRIAPIARQPLGREVAAALLGLLALGITQIVDVFAIRLANPAQSGSYVGAASLARLALFAQMPAAAYALRRAAVEGPRKALPRTSFLALVPGLLAVGLLELFPHDLLHLAYANRYLGSGSTLRILALAMFFGGLATVTAQLLMGSRSTAWAWSVIPVAAFGSPAIIALTHAPTSVAVFSVFIQLGALLAVGVPALAVLRSPQPRARRVLILNWRDTRHPQGGGSEVYVEQVARRLVQGGWEVTLFCGAHPNAPARETVDGVLFIRRGSWRSVYLWGMAYHLLGRFGPHDVVIDVKNGVPFFSPAYCLRPVVCLVHHVHREQWRMNFSPGWARFGWWVESRLSPWIYRRSRHVAVSHATRRELAGLGIPSSLVEIIHNGSDPSSTNREKAEVPTILCLGRLVPHKRVEIVLEAAAHLRTELPSLKVVVAGQGLWLARLTDLVDRLGIAEAVTFAGWVDDRMKQELLREAWVLALPSIKEGWGLAVMEAAVNHTPTVAFRVGGLEESVLDGRTGLLAPDREGFVQALRRVLLDPELRDALGSEAADHALGYSWETTAESFQVVLREALEPREVVAVGEPLPAIEP
jgi:glycosyltransferase involved in cell wall biosynthesis